MNFGIQYLSGNNSITKYSHTAQSACLSAFNYMQLHSDIQQAIVYNATTYEVVRIYSRG